MRWTLNFEVLPGNFFGRAKRLAEDLPLRVPTPTSLVNEFNAVVLLH
jgi:hypothetical protein